MSDYESYYDEVEKLPLRDGFELVLAINEQYTSDHRLEAHIYICDTKIKEPDNVVQFIFSSLNFKLTRKIFNHIKQIVKIMEEDKE